MEYIGKSLPVLCHTTAKYWGGIWGGFLEKIFLNREKTNPKPIPPFWRNVNIYSIFRQFGNFSETLSPAFHAGNRGTNRVGAPRIAFSPGWAILSSFSAKNLIKWGILSNLILTV